MTAQKQTQNSKTGDFRELFLPENGSKTISTVIFPKKHADIGGLEPNQRHNV